jgi:hypothetical protein
LFKNKNPKKTPNIKEKYTSFKIIARPIAMIGGIRDKKEPLIGIILLVNFKNKIKNKKKEK